MLRNISQALKWSGLKINRIYMEMLGHMKFTNTQAKVIYKFIHCTFTEEFAVLIIPGNIWECT